MRKHLGKVDGHESNALSISVWKTDVCLSTPMPGKWLAEPKLGERRLESRAGIAPASWWPCANTFAGRRLNCSANGIGLNHNQIASGNTLGYRDRMPAKKLPKIKPAQLRDAFKIDLTACWRHALALHPDHTPYAFVLNGVEDTPHLYPHVLTEESLTQVARRYLGNGFYETLEEARKGLRYSVADSPHVAELEAKLTTVDGLVEPHEHLFDETTGYALLAKTAMDAFEQLDKEGIFGKGKQREQLLLMIITDECEKNWTVPSVKRLNSSTAFRRYEAETKIEGIYASCDTLAVLPDGRSLYFAGSREINPKSETSISEFVACDVVGSRLKRRWSFSLPHFGNSWRGVAFTHDGTILTLRGKYSTDKCEAIIARFGPDSKTVLQEARVQGEPACFGLSHDGSRVAVAMNDKTLQFFNENLFVLQTVQLNSTPMKIGFLKSGELLVLTDDGLLLIDRDFSIKPTIYHDRAISVSIDANENLLAVSRWFSIFCSDKENNAEFGFQILGLPEMKLVRSFQIPGHQLVRATLSPDGRLVAFEAHEIGKYRRFIVVCESASGREIARRKSDFVHDLAFFSDCKTIAVTANGHTKYEPVVLWDIPNL